MINILSVFFVALSFFSPALSQMNATSQSPSQTATLRSTVRLVDVDIVVTDAKGNPVTGLTQEDFKIAEDKAPQVVRTFDVHTAIGESSPKEASIPSLPANTFLNLETAPEQGTPTVILYDALNMSLTEQNIARQELFQFLKHRRPGTQIALFVLGTRLRLLQGFTQDTDLLSAALASQKGNPRALALQASTSDLALTPGAFDGDSQFFMLLRSFEIMQENDKMQSATWRWENTIDALSELGRFLVPIPGRKNLIWFSSFFQASMFRSDNSGDGHFDSKHLRAMRQVRDLLDVSHTAVYPVSVMGVRASPAFAASKNANYGAKTGLIGIEQTKFIAQENVSHLSMDLIADATGGKAFYGTNDLQEAVDRAMNEGSTYYSLTYSPTNANFDGSLRHIKVTLKKGGYNLAYRRTYYADDLSAAARAVADAPEGPLTPALERGTPLAHGLFLEAHLDTEGTPVAATPAQMQVLAQYAAMQARAGKGQPAGASGPVMMQTYLISYGLIARQLEMPADDAGAHTASLEFGVIAYDDDGRKLNGVDTHIDDAIPAARYAKVASDGYHVAQEVAVPVTAASLRLAVRDVRGNRVGSLEVRLPLVKAGAASGDRRQP